ncbi:VOC family protein [Sporosarcina luteola]|uniref:VOC family protein n=1 Tax=Sporosarcina luteola TaxID=582850 RepID=UPI00203AAF78|nr:VOC family protein [Sporosarcina luteola]MCM3744741.1 VOC family protein [Sporosarcina luteola]
MIHKIGQIMLYVNNQDESKAFWTEKVGFTVLSEEDNGHGVKWIEIAPTAEAETSIVLHNKELVAKMEPELNLAPPSLLLFTENLDALYEDLKSKQVKVGELVTMPTGRVFNFADNEDNYFAVLEKK